MTKTSHPNYLSRYHVFCVCANVTDVTSHLPYKIIQIDSNVELAVSSLALGCSIPLLSCHGKSVLKRGLFSEGDQPPTSMRYHSMNWRKNTGQVTSQKDPKTWDVFSTRGAAPFKKHSFRFSRTDLTEALQRSAEKLAACAFCVAAARATVGFITGLCLEMPRILHHTLCEKPWKQSS